METNWIILALVLIGAITFILFLIIIDQRDKEKVIRHFNAKSDIEYEYERNIEIECTK